METFTPDQLKNKYKLGTPTTPEAPVSVPEVKVQAREVFTPDQLKTQYSMTDTATATEKPDVKGGFVGNLFTGSTQKFGKTAGEAIAAPQNANLYADSLKQHTDTQNKLLKVISDKKKMGQDTTALETALDVHTQSTPKLQDFTGDVINKTNAQVLGEATGTVLEATTGGVLEGGAKTAISKTIPTAQKVKQGAKIGAIYGGLEGGSSAMAEGGNAKDVAMSTLKGAAIGGTTGGILEGAGSKIAKGRLFKTPAERQIADSMAVDNSIRKALEGTTGDVAQLEKVAYGSKKALERLSNELPDIKIPDSKAPIGAGATKQFNPDKATGNEWISAINSLGKKATDNARTAVKEASQNGFTLRTDGAKKAIGQAVDNGEITYATAERLYKQIDNMDGDAEKIFDWVQDVNQKYKNKFEKGTIDDMATSRIANDIAEQFRKELNTITDRTGYAEAISNISDLKKLMVSVAKKANKGVNFGDITSEAGLDAGISLLTGNPTYMARTLASGVFKGIVGKFKNTQGLRSVKKAIKGISKVPNDTKMPSTALKQKRLLLPGAGQSSYKEKESIRKFYTTPKGKTSENLQEAVDVAATEKKSVKRPKSSKSKSEITKMRESIESGRPYVAEKDLPVIKNPKKQKRLKDIYDSLPTIKY